MMRVLLAIGYITLEEYLIKKLDKEFQFVGAIGYREGIIHAIKQNKPDIIIIRETLEGNENILKIINEIRSSFSEVRVVFIAGDRYPGDALLATLIGYGIYDILYGDTPLIPNILDLVRRPTEFEDIKHLQPKPKPIVNQDMPEEENGNGEFEKSPPIYQINQLPMQKSIAAFEKSDAADSGLLETQSINNTIRQHKIVPVQPQTIPVFSQPKAELAQLEHIQTQPKPSEKKLVESDSKTGGFFSKFKSVLAPANDQSNTIPHGVRQKIISFFGAKSGVGTTTLALNAAFELASKGYKVIFIEVNDRFPSVHYLYNIGEFKYGVDTAIYGLETNSYNEISNAIVKTKEIKKQESDYQENYKKFPDSLDFMLYSKRYIKTSDKDKNDINYNSMKDLYMYLLYQMEYDFVILDINTYAQKDILMHSLIYSSQIFFVMTQDISSIGYMLYRLNEYRTNGIQLEEKLHYLVNKYVNAQLNIKGIKQWIQSEKVTKVPDWHKEFADANYLAYPQVLYCDNENIKLLFKELGKLILLGNRGSNS